MKRITAALLALLIVGCDKNQSLTYGDTGLPKNCRAIIKANVESWRRGEYSAEEVLYSIDRNCGEYGYSW